MSLGKLVLIPAISVSLYFRQDFPHFLETAAASVTNMTSLTDDSAGFWNKIFLHVWNNLEGVVPATQVRNLLFCQPSQQFTHVIDTKTILFGLAARCDLNWSKHCWRPIINLIKTWSKSILMFRPLMTRVLTFSIKLKTKDIYQNHCEGFYFSWSLIMKLMKTCGWKGLSATIFVVFYQIFL